MVTLAASTGLGTGATGRAEVTSMAGADYVSLWLDQARESEGTFDARREPMPANADVVIVGGGSPASSRRRWPHCSRLLELVAGLDPTASPAQT
jgi:hypothetical protein